MHRIPRSALTLAVAIPVLLAGGGSVSLAQVTARGAWVGTVPIPGRSLELRLDVAGADSAPSAVMDIPESKLIRFPVPSVRRIGDRLQISVPPKWGLAMFRDIGLSGDEQIIDFDGAIYRDSIAGTLTVAYAKFPLTLARVNEAVLPYRREDVTFRNGDVVLSGTLYLPKAKGPFPVLEFTHGSGDRTRDAYAPEADHLARAGIAALVYDKRGAGRSTGGNWVVATFDELASDAAAGVDYLATRPDIDKRHIGLFGLSQGTWLIGMVADRSPHVGFLVFVSGSGIPVWEQEIYRTTAMMRAEGYTEPELQAAERYQRQKFEVSRTGIGWPTLDSLTKALQKSAKWFNDYGNEYVSLSSARFWWLAAYHYDPTKTLEHLTVPVLGMFGEKDLSFPIPLVPNRMRSDLRTAHNCDVTLRVFPGAEHQLMIPQIYEGRVLRRAVVPEFVPTLTDWISAHARSRTPSKRCESTGRSGSGR